MSDMTRFFDALLLPLVLEAFRVERGALVNIPALDSWASGALDKD